MQYTDEQLIDLVKSQFIHVGDLKDIQITNVYHNDSFGGDYITIDYDYYYGGRTRMDTIIQYVNDIDKFLNKNRRKKINKIKDAIHR